MSALANVLISNCAENIWIAESSLSGPIPASVGQLTNLGKNQSLLIAFTFGQRYSHP